MADKKKQLVKLFKRLFSNRRRKVVGSVLLLFVLGFVSWRVFAGKEEKPQFQTAKVKRGIIVSSVAQPGEASPFGSPGFGGMIRMTR